LEVSGNSAAHLDCKGEQEGLSCEPELELSV
jgi:hypothetical protein